MLCEKPVGRNREVWTGQASRLSLCVLENKQKSVNSRYHNAFGLSVARVWVQFIVSASSVPKRLHGSRVHQSHGCCLIHQHSPRRLWGWSRGPASTNSHARYEWSHWNWESTLVTVFERCSLATCYLASCRCSGEGTFFKLQSFLFGILFVGVTVRANASAEWEPNSKLSVRLLS